MRLYYTTFIVNLIKTTQTVSLLRDNYNTEMCLISSEISILFSSATTVTTINLIWSIPGCFLYEGRWMMGWFREDTSIFYFHSIIVYEFWLYIYVILQLHTLQLYYNCWLKMLWASYCPSNIELIWKSDRLFWFFGGFRCGDPLFIVILVIY